MKSLKQLTDKKIKNADRLKGGGNEVNPVDDKDSSSYPEGLPEWNVMTNL